MYFGNCVYQYFRSICKIVSATFWDFFPISFRNQKIQRPVPSSFQWITPSPFLQQSRRFSSGAIPALASGLVFPLIILRALLFLLTIYFVEMLLFENESERSIHILVLLEKEMLRAFSKKCLFFSIEIKRIWLTRLEGFFTDSLEGYSFRPIIVHQQWKCWTTPQDERGLLGRRMSAMELCDYV